MGPIHESKVAETVPMLCLWECQNKVTFVTQKFIASGSFPLKSGKLHQCKAPPST